MSAWFGNICTLIVESVVPAPWDTLVNWILDKLEWQIRSRPAFICGDNHF